MNRKDLRTSESKWRATKQPGNREWKKPKKGFKVLTALKIIGAVLLAIVLYDNLNQCKSVAGSDSIYCVD